MTPSIFSRKRDLVYLIFFIVHLPVMLGEFFATSRSIINVLASHHLSINQNTFPCIFRHLDLFLAQLKTHESHPGEGASQSPFHLVPRPSHYRIAS
jgi:hypothetical protein